MAGDVAVVKYTSGNLPSEPDRRRSTFGNAVFEPTLIESEPVLRHLLLGLQATPPGRGERQDQTGVVGDDYFPEAPSFALSSRDAQGVATDRNLTDHGVSDS
jgi:hypothetical protein